LHLSIVALSFGVPIYRKRYEATSKFILLDELRSHFQFLDEGPTVIEPKGEVPSLVATYRAELDRHYAHLIAMACGTQGKGHPVGWELLMQIPEALRARRTIAERISDYRLRLRRMRNFTA